MGRNSAVLWSVALAFVAAAQQAPRRREATPEERQKIESALPAAAPAKPGKPRKLLIVDYGAYHPSVPAANFAVERMGAKTGAYVAVISHDTSLLEAEKLQQFDAVYLNNTVGVSTDVFRPELREAFAAFIRNGGGLVANHGSSVASPNWDEYTEILGATGAAHRAADEKIMVKLDDPSHPLNAAFGGKGFEFTDEIFRFKPPSPRRKVHVLFSIDVPKSDMNQGRCTSNCESEDGEFPLSWVRSYGKGRVYYCALGHNANVFWDTRILRHFLAGIQFALGDLEADTTPTSARTITELDGLLERIASYHIGQSRAALVQLSGFISDSLESPGLLQEVEARLLKFVQSTATAPAKGAVLKELSLIATQASVPVLAPMLVRPETAEPARYALARIPGPAAGEALRNALGQASGTVKVGIVSSLGQRRDTNAVPALRTLLSSTDPALADAAAYALGNIGGSASLSALAAAREKASGARREPISEAYLQCASALAANGNRNEALNVFRQLSAAREPEMIRIAALTGLTDIEGQNAAQALAAAVAAENPKVQAAAIRLLAGIPGPAVTASLLRQFPNLPPAGQVRLITALTVRGDPSARPLLLDASKSASAEVRAAALAAMGKMGDTDSVPLLAEAAAHGQPPEQNAARRGLTALSGAKVDAAILAAIGSSNGKVKSELIVAAGERHSPAAAGVMIQAARDQDPEVRRNALRALKNVAGPAEVAPLLEMVKTSAGTDQKDAAQALAAALKRSPAAAVAAVISAYGAAASVDLRLALLDALGQTSASDVLPVMREGLRDSNQEIVRGAVLALTNWPDPAPLPDLLAMAQTSSSPAVQTLSLRGVLKLISIPSTRSAAESAKLLAGAMRLARDAAEKRAVLALLPSYPCDEALSLAEASLNDPAVVNEAKASLQRIRNALKMK